MLNHFPVWIEIDLDAAEHNLKVVRQRIGTRTAVMAIVKADAYGHGAIELAKFYQAGGVEYFGVATLEEGIQLRQGGITVPVLLLTALLPEQASSAADHNLSLTISEPNLAAAAQQAGHALNQTIKVHLKVDTGMGRVGCQPEEALTLARYIKQQSHLELEGVFTHFATATQGENPYLHHQARIFEHTVRQLEAEGLTFAYRHAATSGVIMDFPQYLYDMARPGLMLYGLYPAAAMRDKLELRPVLSLKAKVSFVKTLARDMPLSYDCTYQAQAGAVIATLPLGYADGYVRALSNQGQALLRGQRVPVVGKVCMDHILIDVSVLPGVQPGEEVVLLGAQGHENLRVEEWAEKLHTISYELLAGLGKRLPRKYYRGSKLVALKSSLL